MRPSEVIARLKKAGYAVDHQTGSHVILYKKGKLPLSVPKHNRDVKMGTLRHIVRSAGFSDEEFLGLK